MNINKKIKPKGLHVKRICIALTVLFTLILAADIANLFITPVQNRMSFNPGEFSVNPEMPDMEAFRMPEDGDFQMPGRGDMPAFDGEEGMPAFGDMPGMNQVRRNGGFLQSIRKAWLPIMLVCLLGDAACIYILLRLRQGQNEDKEPTYEETIAEAAQEEEDDEQPPKRKRGPWIALLCLAIAFSLILTMLPTAQIDGSSATVEQVLISGNTEAAQINTVLSGAGTLQADSLTAVTVPQQVSVLKYHVRNGETVCAGEPLVSVDKTSALSALKELNEVLEDLDDDLEAQRQSSNPSYIYSTAAGRVKKIYAAAGDKVADILYDNGALLLLSLDGLMKVEFESEKDIAVGDSVIVEYSEGRETGRIAAIRQGKVTVTLSDENALYGHEASITTQAGELLGKGRLEINSALKVINYYGTISRLYVGEGDRVSIGTTLMLLEDTGYTADYQLLLSRRKELEAQMQKLSGLAQTGMVYAENDGIVSGVPDNAEIELLAENSFVSAGNLSNSSSGWRLVFLSDSTAESTEPEPESTPEPTPTPTDAPEPTNTPESTLEPMPTPAVTPEPGPTPAVPLNGSYAASLVSVDSASGKIYVWLAPTVVGGDSGLDLSSLKGQMTQFGGYSYSGIESKSIPIIENGQQATATLGELKQNDLLLLSFSNDVVTDIVMAQRSSSSTPDTPFPGGASGGMPTGGGTMGAMYPDAGAAVQKSYEQYIVEQTTLLYISDQEEVTLSITVDELDILSLELGAEAQVALDAMRGQAFIGTIERIAHEGTTDGDGNTKFSVTIVLPREAAMLDGMNGSVEVITASKAVAAAIPAAALIEEDGKTYVYTQYDDKKDILSGLVEVETGVSDGELVEILSGISPDDTFYYRYAGTVTYSFLANA